MRISNEIMLKTRARCPCCRTRLNENTLNWDMDLIEMQCVII